MRGAEAGVFRREDDGCGEFVDASAKEDAELIIRGFRIAPCFAGGSERSGQGREGAIGLVAIRVSQATGPGVIALRRDVKGLGRGEGREQRADEQPRGESVRADEGWCVHGCLDVSLF